MIKHNGKLMLAGCVLGASLLCLPSAPARAGGRDAAIAAGIIGAVATGIIVQQHMNRSAPKAARRSAPKASKESEATASNAKDPFAGTGAPAGYATPVANKPMQ